jgi:death-on-curing family protein
MVYLTAEQNLFLHARLVAETGGSHGVGDLNLLLSAVSRPKASFDDRDLYPDLFTQSAVLMDSLINNHPFVDGNKRTGISAAALFLQANDYHSFNFPTFQPSNLPFPSVPPQICGSLPLCCNAPVPPAPYRRFLLAPAAR